MNQKNTLLRNCYCQLKRLESKSNRELIHVWLLTCRQQAVIYTSRDLKIKLHFSGTLLSHFPVPKYTTWKHNINYKCVANCSGLFNSYILKLSTFLIYQLPCNSLFVTSFCTFLTSCVSSCFSSYSTHIYPSILSLVVLPILFV